MKKEYFIMHLVTLIIISAGVSAFSQVNTGISTAGNKKILVAYFSHTGNTREIAVEIRKITGGDISEIQGVKPYPSDYEETKKIAMQELKSGYKPPLKNSINIRSYDIIFVGYPIWWGTFPAPVKTFLSENNFSGKTIVPFSTHLGSGLGISTKDIRKLCPESTLLEGISIRGNDTKNVQNRISQWLKKLNIIK